MRKIIRTFLEHLDNFSQFHSGPKTIVSIDGLLEASLSPPPPTRINKSMINGCRRWFVVSTKISMDRSLNYVEKFKKVLRSNVQTNRGSKLMSVASKTHQTIASGSIEFEKKKRFVLKDGKIGKIPENFITEIILIFFFSFCSPSGFKREKKIISQIQFCKLGPPPPPTPNHLFNSTYWW